MTTKDFRGAIIEALLKAGATVTPEYVINDVMKEVADTLAHDERTQDAINEVVSRLGY